MSLHSSESVDPVEYWRDKYLALRESTKDWYKHPAAQNEIALKARLRLELSHIEAIVRGDSDLGIDDDYWSTLCDDVLKLRTERDQLREAAGKVCEVCAGQIQNDGKYGAIDDLRALLKEEP